MGRFIGIGILFQVDADPDTVSAQNLKQLYSPTLFDYSNYLKESSIKLNAEITPANIWNLRKGIIDFCDLPTETQRDSSTGWKSISLEKKLKEMFDKLSLNELIDVAKNKEYYTFQEMEQRQLRFCGGEMIGVTPHYFLIYMSPWKFYPSGGHLDHEITRKVDRLIYLGLGQNKVKALSRCFITQ